MYRFNDAQKMHEQYPATFEAPTQAQLDNVKSEDSVKVSHKNERFWVTVTNVEKDVITGVVDNKLIFPHPFQLGDKIVFKKKHIYTTYE